MLPGRGKRCGEFALGVGVKRNPRSVQRAERGQVASYLASIDGHGVGFCLPILFDPGISFEADHCARTKALERFNGAAANVEPGEEIQVIDVRDFPAVDIAAENEMSSSVIEERVHNAVDQLATDISLSPERALAVDHRLQGNGLSAEGTGPRRCDVPEEGDFADGRVAHAFRAEVHTIFLEFVDDAVAAFKEVLDAAGGMCRVPVVADREIRKHVDVNRLLQAVVLTRKTNALGAGAGHIFGKADDVRIFSRPVTAFPELAVGTARDDGRIPSGTAAIGVVVVVGECDAAIVFRTLGKEMAQTVQTADARIDFSYGGIAGILSAILPAPEMRNLRRVAGQAGNLANELFAFRKRGRGLFEFGFVAADAVDKFAVVIASGPVGHARADEAGGIEPVHGTFFSGREEEVDSAGRFLADQKIWRFLVATVGGSAGTGVHVEAEAAVDAVTLNGAEETTPMARFARNREQGVIHERCGFLDASGLACANHDDGKAGHDMAPKAILGVFVNLRVA